MVVLSESLYHQIQSQLAASQYEKISLLLEEACQKMHLEGDLAAESILAAAVQLCLTCSRLHQELDRIEQTREELAEQEAHMSQHLLSLLHPSQESGPKTAVSPSSPDLNSAPAPTTPFPRIRKIFDALFTPQTFLEDKKKKPLNGKVSLPISSGALQNGHQEVPAPPRQKQFPIAENSDSKANSLALDTPPDLTIYTLGNFRLYQNDHLIQDWNGQKGLMILKYLISHQCKPVAKEKLMDIFWPDVEPEAARRNLHQAVYSLRQTLKSIQPDVQYVLYENDRYSLNPALNIWIDLYDFETHIQRGKQHFEQGDVQAAMTSFGIAEGLYAGDFLQEDHFEEWTFQNRNRLQALYLEISDCLSQYYLQKREYSITIGLCQKILSHDNYHEAAYRRLMSCYVALGQRHLAIRSFQNCQEILKKELDLTPAPETMAIYQQLMATP